MLFQVNRSDPWYADIVNFIVVGYVPPRGNKKKLIYESHIHLWDESYLFRVCSEGVYQWKKDSRSLNAVTHHHMEDIMEHSEHMQKS
jgi:hypothetical protein